MYRIRGGRLELSVGRHWLQANLINTWRQSSIDEKWAVVAGQHRHYLSVKQLGVLVESAELKDLRAMPSDRQFIIGWGAVPNRLNGIGEVEASAFTPEFVEVTRAEWGWGPHYPQNRWPYSKGPTDEEAATTAACRAEEARVAHQKWVEEGQRALELWPTPDALRKWGRKMLGAKAPSLRAFRRPEEASRQLLGQVAGRYGAGEMYYLLRRWRREMGYKD